MVTNPIQIRFLIGLLIFLLPSFNSTLIAQTNKSDEITANSQQLDQIDKKLSAGIHDENTFNAWLKDISVIKSSATKCAATAAESRQKITQDLNSLGVEVKGEPADVTNKRKLLTEEKSRQEAREASCRLLLLRSDEATQRITNIQKEILTKRLLARGPTFFTIIKNNWSEPAAWINSTKAFLLLHSGAEKLSIVDLIIVGLIVAVTLTFGLLIRRRLLQWADSRHWNENFYYQLSLTLVVHFAHYATHLLVSIGLAAFFFFALADEKPIAFISVVAYGLPVYFLLLATIHIFLDPHSPAQSFYELSKEIAKALARRLKVLILLIFLGYLLFSTLLAQSLPEQALLLARGVFAAVFILNIIWILWLLGDIPRFKNTRWMRLGLYLLLFSILIAEWLGYRNLSFILLRGLFGTVIVFGIFILADRLFSELYDELDQGRYSWHRRIKIALGLKTLEHIPGLVWLRVITAIVIWGAFVFIILRIWDLSDTALQQIQDYLVEGFTIGSLRVIPLRVLLAAVTFLFLFTISSWLRSRLERSWLSKAYMERGAREAIVTISGYTGMAIAILVALGVAGLEFSNFAIIAGALSVGIGFGLQNIVNNFVSGLILLFERPIKTGDWIVVGGTEGYVKRIRIRSTQIQTFDRADVIVPNSELISGQVTNWMLYDPRGRVVIPVGVAYGSDTEMVKNILLEVADKHPLVISNEPTMEAKVLFMAFGESSLDFELRCYIQNIDNRLQVKSDLNFAIDAAFRKHGIEIPFPQRDIHFKNMLASDNRSSPPNSLK